MSVKLFVLGQPGSGKSTAFRNIVKHLEMQYQGWSTTRFNDYEILQSMFRFERLFENDSKKRKFCATEHGGFDVLDFSVLDIALKKLEKQVRETCSDKDELILIEFARQNYSEALRLFSSTFLNNSYFLFIEADMKTCMQRVKDRVTDPPTLDNHFVSEDIFTKYYGKQSIPSNFKIDQGVCIDKKRIKVINSQGTQKDFEKKVNQFIDIIIKYETQPLVDNPSWWNLPKKLAQFSDAKHKIHPPLSTKRVIARTR